MQLIADRRADAIGSNQDVSHGAGAVDEVEADAGVIGVESDGAAIDLDCARPQGTEQRPMQLRPKNHLKSIAGREITRLGDEPAENAAVHAAELRAGWCHRVRRDRAADAKLPQRRRGIRCKPEREADVPRRRGALENADIPARPAQRNPGGQPADPSAGD